MAMTKGAVSVTVASGETSGHGTTAQIVGELAAIALVLPDGAPVGAQYHIYQTAPQITLLEVSGQQVADQDDNLFCPRKNADTQDGQPIGGGDTPFPAIIPLHSSVRMDVSGAVPGIYVAYLYYNK